MAKKLPKTIYVKWDEDEEFVIASDAPEGISEVEETIKAGEYKLVRTVKITKNTVVE